MNKPLRADYGKGLLVRGVYRTPRIQRKDIMQFVGALHEIQHEYLEQAVEKSGYADARAVIKNIMEKK